MEMSEKNTVNEALKLPLVNAFEADLTKALMESGEVQPVVVAMIDVDGLMRVNDEFGFEAGDQMLIQMGEYLRANLDCPLYRVGGDQFAALYTGEVEKEDAFLLLEGVRARYPVKRPDGKAASISVGIAASPEDGVRYFDLVRKSEGALMRAKAGDKNRVCLAREEKMVTKTSHYAADQLARLTKLSKREGLGEAVLLREALDTLLRKYDV